MTGIEAGKLIYQVQADMSAIRKQLDGLEKMVASSAKKTSSSIIDIVPPAIKAAASITGITAVMYKCVSAASDLEEQTSKFNTVFGSQQKLAEGWADTLVRSYAMSTREAKQNLAAMMDLLEPMGMNAKAAASMSFEVTKLAADLGSFNNLPTAQVMGDIQSALVGNFETMKKYGVVLNETVTQEEGRRLGLIKGKETLTASQRAEVAYQLILKGSKNAIGDMARTQDSFANTIKKLWASIEDLAAGIGSVILPPLARFASAASNVAQALTPLFRMLADTSSIEKQNSAWKMFNVELDYSLRLIKQYAEAKVATNAIQKQAAEVKALSDEIRNSARQMGLSTSEFIKKAKAGTLPIADDFKALAKDMVLAYEKAADQSVDSIGKTTTATKQATSAQGDALRQLAKDRKNMEFNLLKTTYEAQGKKEALFDLEYQKAVEEAEKIGVAREKVDAAFAAKREKEMYPGKEYFESEWYTQHIPAALNAANQITGQLGNVFAMDAQNRMQRVENEKTQALETIATIYDAEKAHIEATVTDKKERDAQLKALDEKRAREEKFITEKLDKEKRKIAREAAKQNKAIAITETIINTASAAMGAASALARIPYVGPALAAVAAAAMAALGATQVALISSQPLPEAAEGIYAESPYIGGEAGPELAFPLGSDRGKRAMSLMAEQLLAAIEEKIGTGQSKSSATLAPAERSVEIYRVAPMSRQAFFDELYQASQNGELFIAKRGVQ